MNARANEQCVAQLPIDDKAIPTIIRHIAVGAHAAYDGQTCLRVDAEFTVEVVSHELRSDLRSFIRAGKIFTSGATNGLGRSITFDTAVYRGTAETAKNIIAGGIPGV